MLGALSTVAFRPATTSFRIHDLIPSNGASRGYRPPLFHNNDTNTPNERHTTPSD